MYEVSVSREFIAQHYLIGADFGAENDQHSHYFKIQLIIKHDQLDQHKYVCDIDKIKLFFDSCESKYKDKCLNDCVEFKNENPSIELFSKVIHSDFMSFFSKELFHSVKVIVWEDGYCYASYCN